MLPRDPTVPAVYIAIGRHVADLRRERGLSQEALSDLADVHAVMVSRVERGATNARLSTLLKLAAALDVDLGELVAGASDAAH